MAGYGAWWMASKVFAWTGAGNKMLKPIWWTSANPAATMHHRFGGYLYYTTNDDNDSFSACSKSYTLSKGLIIVRGAYRFEYLLDPNKGLCVCTTRVADLVEIKQSRRLFWTEVILFRKFSVSAPHRFHELSARSRCQDRTS